MEGSQDSSFQGSRRERLRRWRRLYRIGGLALGSAFFMPSIKGCGGPYIPAIELVRNFEPGDYEYWLWFIPMVMGAYLFGLLGGLLTIRGDRPIQEQEGAVQGIITAWVGMIAVTQFANLVILAVGGLRSGRGLPGEFWAVTYITLALISPLYWVRSLRCGPAGRVALRWYASMVCVIWFGSFLIAEPTSTFYGWWLSLAGSATMCLAAFAEARVLSAQSVVATLASLVTCRLALRSLDEPYCTKCGYLLVGLTLPRCPECGQAFPIDMDTNAAPP